MDMEALRGRTIEFLKEYCRLDRPGESVVFSSPYECEGFMSTLAMSYPWYRRDPAHYQPPIKGDWVQDAYNRMQHGLDVHEEKRFIKDKLDKIPDSEEFVLVDIGSSMGRNYTRPAARKKPNLRVFMIDRMTRQDLEEEYRYAFEHFDWSEEELHVRVPISDDVEATMNELMQANGYQNIRYIERDLSLHDETATELPSIIHETRGRRVIVTGVRNPTYVAYSTVSEALYHAAEQVHITQSSLEKISLKNPIWIKFRKFVGSDLTEAEIRKYISLVNDPVKSERPKTCKHNLSEREKYDVGDEKQKRIAIALKQLFVLFLAHRLHAYHTQIHLADSRSLIYNNPHHIISASR